MRFNVSRFLVRLRQFWTRERLVPVLGFTALALFLLNFWTFIQYQFNNAPVNASYVLGGSFFSDNNHSNHVHGGTFFDSDRDFQKFRHRHSARYNHKKSKRSHCKSEKQGRVTYERYFEIKRFNDEAERFQDHAERYREEIDRLQKEVQSQKIREIVHEVQQLSDLKEKKIVIKKLSDGSKMDVTILVDGEVVEEP